MTIITPTTELQPTKIRDRPKTTPQAKRTFHFKYSNLSGTTSSSNSAENLKKGIPIITKTITANQPSTPLSVNRHRPGRIPVSIHLKRHFDKPTEEAPSGRPTTSDGIGDHANSSRPTAKASTNRYNPGHLTQRSTATTTRNIVVKSTFKSNMPSTMNGSKAVGVPIHCAARAAYRKTKNSVDNV